MHGDDFFIFYLFSGEVKVKGGTDGINMRLTREGRPSGEAYIEVESEADIEKGLKMNKKEMGRRYIEGKNTFLEN